MERPGIHEFPPNAGELKISVFCSALRLLDEGAWIREMLNYMRHDDDVTTLIDKREFDRIRLYHRRDLDNVTMAFGVFEGILVDYWLRMSKGVGPDPISTTKSDASMGKLSSTWARRTRAPSPVGSAAFIAACEAPPVFWQHRNSVVSASEDGGLLRNGFPAREGFKNGELRFGRRASPRCDR